MTEMTPVAAIPAANMLTPIPATTPAFLKLYIENDTILKKTQNNMKIYIAVKYTLSAPFDLYDINYNTSYQFSAF